MKRYSEVVNVSKRVLNPKLWRKDQSVHPHLRSFLIERARHFLEMIGLDPRQLDDIRIVGSQTGWDYDNSSDLDVTVMVAREPAYSKEQMRQLGISTSNFNYRYSPEVAGIPTNFYLSQRNVGGLRPIAGQGVYSLMKNEWIKRADYPKEFAPGFLASKAESYIQQIESCITDDTQYFDDCAGKLLDKLKKMREKSLIKTGEQGEANLVYRLLRKQGYLHLLHQKTQESLEQYFNWREGDLVEECDCDMPRLVDPISGAEDPMIRYLDGLRTRMSDGEDIGYKLHIIRQLIQQILPELY